MKAFLFYVSIIILFIGCKNELYVDDDGKILDINLIKSDFQKKTGYRQSDSSFINPSFKSVIDWSTFYEVGKDTLYVKVKVIDKLEILVSDSTRVLLNNNIWIRVTKENDKWQYSVLTFVSNSTKAEYSGIIISKSLQSGAQNISFYEVNTKVSAQLVKRAGKAPAMPTDCIYAYVNGILNEITCSGGSGDDGSDNPPYAGDPRDYQNIPPPGGGGGGSGGDGTVPTYTSDKDRAIIDSLQGYPCAQDIIKNLPNLENEVSAWLNAVFNNNTSFNVTFSDDPTLAGTKTDAEHRAFGTVNGQTHKITINPDVLSSSSKEYIVATMFHEVLHGFLNYERLRLNAEGRDDQFGILYAGWNSVQINGQQRFVKNHATFGSQLDKLKMAIKSFNPNLSDYDALALAKNGIVTSLDAVESSLNDNHRRGKAGTTCKP